MRGPFFIHLDDPGFPEHPWPGQRRLGPYPTSAEALEQAVSDASLGLGVAAGIYEQAESEKRLAGKRGKATVTRARIQARGETIARRRQEEQAAEVEQTKRDIEAMLPAGVGWEEVVLAARAMQERVEPGQSYRTIVHPEPVAEA